MPGLSTLIIILDPSSYQESVIINNRSNDAYYWAAVREGWIKSTEGFGIVFLEAMACGTPTLAGNRDGSVDALDEGRLGRLVDPMNIDAIATGIIELLNRQGPEWWFDPQTLANAVVRRFGRAAFRKTLAATLSWQPTRLND